MISSHSARALLGACLVVTFTDAISGAELNSVDVNACRGVTCETSHTRSGSAVIEIRGRSQRDAGSMLDLVVYDGANYEIAYYDTLEVPAVGNFTLRVPLGALRPGSYTFSVAPRHSGALLGAGSFTAAPRVLPHVPPWPAQRSLD